MGRKIQITKKIILETALQMLIRDGYTSITVKTLAAEIGCSTQPIVWHFETTHTDAEGVHSLAAVQNAIKSREPFQNAIHRNRPVLFLLFPDLHPLGQFLETLLQSLIVWVAFDRHL